MAGVLSFALGLETSAFGTALSGAATRLLGFMAIGSAVSNTFEKMWESIERGGRLQDESNRTGQSIEDLYRMGEAFKVVGIESSSVAPMINRLQKSLAGTGEMGEKTGDAFAALGLDMAQLNKMGAPEQFEAIASQMAKMDQGKALNIAQTLFGREGAGNIVQASRDLQDFRKTLAETKSEAALMGQAGKAFDPIGDMATRLGSKWDIMWTGITLGAAPAFQKIVTMLDSIPFQKIGEGIGSVFTVITNAFAGGQLFGLITSSFEAAMEFIGNATFNVFDATIGNPSFWASIWDRMKAEFGMALSAMLKGALTLGDALSAGLDTAIQRAIQGLGNNPIIGKLLGVEGYKGLSFTENYAQRRAEAAPMQAELSTWFKESFGDYKTAWGNIGGMIGEALKKSTDGPAQKALLEKIAALLPNATTLNAGNGNPNPDPNQNPQGSPLEKAQAGNDWQRIGLFMGSGAYDIQRDQLNVQRQMAARLSDISKAMLAPGKALLNT